MDNCGVRRCGRPAIVYCPEHKHLECVRHRCDLRPGPFLALLDAIATRAVFELDLRRNSNRRDSANARRLWYREFEPGRRWRVADAIARTAALPDCWRDVGKPYQRELIEVAANV